MINWDKVNKKVSVNKIILPIFIATSVVLTIVYANIIKKTVASNKFVNNMIEIVEKNENPIFSIEKIYVCSSANAIDHTEEQNLNNLDLYQYTDIAIYINNNNEDENLTEKNTVKELYIDNIDLQLNSNIGTTNLVYTNLLKFGSKDELKKVLKLPENLNKERIDFNIVKTNEENKKADYEKPTFYADCSNPITLKYINELGKDYSIGKDESASFDGSILQKAGVTIEDINCKVGFRINIVNNEGELYSSKIDFEIPLNDIYEGTSIKSNTKVGNKYIFLTI